MTGKNLENRPRPQKQLSQPTLGAVELMDNSRLRGSQSSEGPELTHSLSVSSPSNTTHSVDASRDADIGEL